MAASSRPPGPHNSVPGPSDPTRPPPSNPQLGPEPWFAYPTPTPEQLDEELPPYFESENVGLGPILERVTRRGYGDLRGLLEHTLPTSPMNQKPRHIIDYAKNQRQAVLKYLAILRWKAAVDIPIASSSHVHPVPSFPPGVASFPTPHSNGESNDTSPAAGYVGKGKGRASDDDDGKLITTARGKVTDAKRVTHFMEHQNKQHEMAVDHVEHVAKGIESLRERNPDLLTAISLLTLGTYNRLPSSLTEPFKPLPPLTNRAILRTLCRLNRHLAYRLRCVDHLPPEIVIEAIRDGKVYLGSGGDFGWKAQITVVGFGEGSEGRWWLTGVEWGWREKQKETDDPGGVDASSHKQLVEEERQRILEIVNNEVLVPKSASKEGMQVDEEEDGSETETLDAPLVRLHNFLQHLSLSYQLETLCAQATALSQGKWRGQLSVNLDRQTKTLKTRYWIRQRSHQQSQQPGSNKRNPPSSVAARRPPLIGGVLSIQLSEARPVTGSIEDLMRDILSGEEKTQERTLRLQLTIKWEVGEGGVGGGLKTGDAMDASQFEIDPKNLSFEDLLNTATRTHASHLVRQLATPLLTAPRLCLFPLNPPAIVERDTDTTPLSLRIPLPSRQKTNALVLSVSSLTGLIEISDEGATEARNVRAKIASAGVNESKSRLLDDLGRLITAIITENLEGQMRQLGWQPTRRLALRSQDLAKNELHPASSIFVPLPTSPLHHFVAKVSAQGVSFELLKMQRVTADNGVGLKLGVGDRSPMDLERLRARRLEKELANAKRTGGNVPSSLGSALSSSKFEIDNRDLKDLFIFCNALVAQTIVEQQLKDRSIPHTLQYPPPNGPGTAESTSAVAGMVPTICVHARDLLKDGRAADVAYPRVYVQIQDWWKGGKCHVVTVVQLRHKPTLSSNEASSAAAEAVNTAEAEGITFDQVTSVVRFRAGDIGRCVPSFLEQWERLSKVIVVAGEVNRLNKSEQFKDLRMLSFDLRTATFSYSPGHTAAITYTPSDDSYEVSFKAEEGASPHDIMSGLLSYRLNELTSNVIRRNPNSTAGVQFIGLLRNTLPFLQKVHEVRQGKDFPALVVRSVTEYRLVWDVENVQRYIVDVTLLSGARYLVTDGSRNTSDVSCGRITPIAEFGEIINKVYEALKENGGAKNGNGSGMPVRLDGGASLVCPVGTIGEVVGIVVGEVVQRLGL